MGSSGDRFAKFHKNVQQFLIKTLNIRITRAFGNQEIGVEESTPFIS